MPAAEAPAPLPAPALKGDARAAFDRALIAYKAGALDDARREFLAIVESGQLSAALAHNLGNVEFRRGQQGQAVLWYRRALALQPASPETLQNLRTVRKQVAFVSFDPFMLSWSHISPAWIKKATILSAWALGLVLVWLIWVTPSRGRRWPLVTLLVLLVPTVSLGVVLTWKTRTDPHPLTKRQVIGGEPATAFARSRRGLLHHHYLAPGQRSPAYRNPGQLDLLRDPRRRGRPTPARLDPGAPHGTPLALARRPHGFLNGPAVLGNSLTTCFYLNRRA